MASNGAKNVEDADMTECDGEKVVTMMDVLQEQQDIEDDANAVLGASDEKNCTYAQGYIKRQAIYACLTCCTEAKDDPTKRAGVCLACSLNCHENHELIELYTKRNFRCDCGNPKFKSHPCQFTPDKSDLNDDNIYNQNFSGLYCNCHRPYPDPESALEDEEMIQCIICEDWLHASHLDAVVPGNDQYSEMICKACMEKNEFLHDYSNLTVNVEIAGIDIIAVNGTDMKLTNGDSETEKLVNGTVDLSGGDEKPEKPQNEMDVDEAQTKNESQIDSGETMENQELQNPIEKNESEIVPMEAQNTENPAQITSNENSKSKEDTNPAITLEESTKANKDTLEDQSSSQELKETLFENAEEAKEILEQDMPESEKSGESSDNNVENTESSETKDETTETKDETTEMTLENDKSEAKDETAKNSLENGKAKDRAQTPTFSTENDEAKEGKKSKEGTAEITSEIVNKDATAKFESENLDTKQEEVSQTTNENDDTSGDTKTSLENDSEMIDSSKEIAETANTDLAKLEGTTNQTEITEINKPPNELTTAAEINDNESKIESNETPKDVNTDEPSVHEVEVPSETVNNIQKNNESKRKLSTEEAEDNNLVKKPKLGDESKCTRPKGVKKVHNGATFWPSNFRHKLCNCSECLSMYKDLSVLFLLDPEDTVFAYETLGKERVDGRATQYEKGLEALSSLDRIQQINALTEYNKMKDKLLDFLKSFKDRKEIVKEEDIKEFFAGMKPKREPDGVYFCR